MTPAVEPVTAPGRAGARSRRGFWTVAAVLGLFLAAASAPPPLYADYAARWQFGAATITVIFAVYAIALLAVLLTAGSLSDSLGRRPSFRVARRRPPRLNATWPPRACVALFITGVMIPALARTFS